MKKLDTLISDIYSMLDGLSHGKPLSINESELDTTLDNIKQSILEWSNPSDLCGSFGMIVALKKQPMSRSRMTRSNFCMVTYLKRSC